MSKSLRTFERWNTITKSTWAFQVFNKYIAELSLMRHSNEGAKKYVYKNLKAHNASWNEKASKYLLFNVPNGEEAFISLKSWSDSFNDFHNWVNLNALMALSSNLETYLSTCVTLAIESDPGVLFESPRSIDGAYLLKRNAKKSTSHDEIIVSITKGDWNSRVSAFKRIFGNIPPLFEKNIGPLEKIRTLRNKVGHAFGRDIEGSRNHEVKKILPMESLNNIQLDKCQKIIWSSAKSIDKYLLRNHIGEYQAIAFYHRLFPELRKDVHPSERAILLKKSLGGFGDVSGKEYCKGLVLYYEAL